MSAGCVREFDIETILPSAFINRVRLENTALDTEPSDTLNAWAISR